MYLKQSCNHYLAKTKKLNVSQMERLINERPSSHVTLLTQSRMRTEIVPFLGQFYKDLKSNKHVDELLPPPCMNNKSFFFWDHVHQETKIPNGGILNKKEAELCATLACWLAWNSKQEGKDICVLAFYKGLHVRVVRFANNQFH